MFEIPPTKVKFYIFPEDHDLGKNDFLTILRNPYETYIFAYNFSLPELLKEIQDCDDKGIPVHALIDHVQFNGPSEKEAVTKLATNLKHGEIIVTTAGVGSDSKGQIWHYKTLLTLNPTGAECWEGSVNFSSSGFSQGNTAIYFISDEYAQVIKDEFSRHKAWALQNHPEYTPWYNPSN